MWSIGIYSGASPFGLNPLAEARNPVLTRHDVSDVPAAFVADPFMISSEGRWYMFFEVMNSLTNKGEIGLATSDDCVSWQYQQIVLSEGFHLSYPSVFEWDGVHYMIPETLRLGAVSLYRAEDFPTRWSCVGPLIAGIFADPSILRFDNRWWLFVPSNPYEHDRLSLYYADNLAGPWREHPASPIIEANNHNARPAGRVIATDGALIRFAQDCFPTYGMQVRAFEISQLTINRYAETEHKSSPLLTPSGVGWNAHKMHHIDPHVLPGGGWIACVDGFAESTSESPNVTDEV
ncbi:MAG TPA: hypothetical protein VGJ66_16630 [Pyrinomonadaceae bacterium]|jgi:hypothetical protein